MPSGLPLQLYSEGDLGITKRQASSPTAMQVISSTLKVLLPLSQRSPSSRMPTAAWQQGWSVCLPQQTGQRSLT